MDGVMTRNMTKALSANRISSSIHAEGDQKSPLHRKEGSFVFTPLHRAEATGSRSSWKRSSIIEDEEVFVAGLTFHSSNPPFDTLPLIKQDDTDIPSSQSFSNPVRTPNHSPALIRCSSIPDDIQHHQLVFQFGEKYRRQSIATELHAVISRRLEPPPTRGLPTSTKSVPNFHTIVELEVGRDLRIISDMFNIESAGTVAGYKFAGYQFASRRRSEVKRIYSLPDPLLGPSTLAKSKSLDELLIQSV